MGLRDIGGKNVIALTDALEAFALTDTGLARDHNEDAVFVDPTSGLAILADGMGGYNAGEVASGMAVSILSEALRRDFAAGLLHGAERRGDAGCSERTLLERISMANSAILRASLNESEYAGMGTTLVAAVFHDNRVTVAHLGDSRLYRLRGGELRVVTRDHSLLQEQIDAGLVTPREACYYDKSLVTRALGVEARPNTESHTYSTRPGDLYLLCSDGLNDMVDGCDILKALLGASRELGPTAECLIRMANDNGGYDNVSVILVRVLRDFPASRESQEPVGLD
ncbi:MAG: protein phosphatase 2C domain-containing protein [Candidatus Accumulibacter sp.]|jgi:protein phosphatase|nr:protein phosphatase 2C domain-containing protein [Accumulibacter sp.]